MFLADAVRLHIDEIVAEEERQAQAKAQANADAETKRQCFITSLRERIELQYGVELTAIDVSEWKVTEMAGNLYEMRWSVEGGSVMLALNISTEDVGDGGIDFAWSAYHAKTRWTVGFDSLVRAIAYAKTGKSL